MSEQVDPKHLEAVGNVLEQTSVSDDARAILTSTDPAVHAALLAALVRAGVLEANWTVRHSQGVHPGEFTEESARQWVENDRKADDRRQSRFRNKQAVMRRYATRWEDA